MRIRGRRYARREVCDSRTGSMALTMAPKRSASSGEDVLMGTYPFLASA
jgi:hypothetical protein